TAHAIASAVEEEGGMDQELSIPHPQPRCQGMKEAISVAHTPGSPPTHDEGTRALPKLPYPWIFLTSFPLTWAKDWGSGEQQNSKWAEDGSNSPATALLHWIGISFLRENRKDRMGLGTSPSSAAASPPDLGQVTCVNSVSMLVKGSQRLFLLLGTEYLIYVTVMPAPGPGPTMAYGINSAPGRFTAQQAASPECGGDKLLQARIFGPGSGFMWQGGLDPVPAPAEQDKAAWNGLSGAEQLRATTIPARV
ncbi:hypothetical protein Nmel_010831, partial [Mimus melanotis]